MEVIDRDGAGLTVEMNRDAYTLFGRLPDGRVCGVLRLMFHWTMHVDVTDDGYAERYCFATLAGALYALQEWDGQGDPDGWHRHMPSCRRRDLVTGREWVEG